MNRITLLLGLLIYNIVSALPSIQDLPPPYNELKEILPFDPHGWYQNAYEIENLIKKYNVKTIIEVGSWLGLSTRHMASLLPVDGKVYAIDHWLGSAEHQPGQGAWYPALPYLYEQFLSNIIHAGLANKIIPIRMSSLEAAKVCNFKPDLIYIDASHETEAVYTDLQIWYPYVKGHGILCGDDWSWPSVRKAVEKHAQENGLKIIADKNFWRLKE